MIDISLAAPHKISVARLIIDTPYLLASFQLKAPSTLCRAAASECDLPEFCHGNTEWCPSDVHKQNGLTCDNEQVS